MSHLCIPIFEKENLGPLSVVAVALANGQAEWVENVGARHAVLLGSDFGLAVGFIVLSYTSWNASGPTLTLPRKGLSMAAIRKMTIPRNSDRIPPRMRWTWISMSSSQTKRDGEQGADRDDPPQGRRECPS